MPVFLLLLHKVIISIYLSTTTEYCYFLKRKLFVPCFGAEMLEACLLATSLDSLGREEGGI